MRKLVALAAVLLVSACTAAGDRREPAPISGRPSPEAGCAAQVHQDQLPEWARAGFSPDARVPYALSRSGQMVGVLFGYPLSQPPADGRANKILWVSGPASPTPYDRTAPGADDLVIDARLDGRGEPVEQRVVGGPGPSVVDLPSPGCWRLSLSWSGRTDSIDLDYGRPR